MEIVNVHQMGLHEVEELAVGVDENDNELLALSIELDGGNIGSKAAAVGSDESNLAMLVEFHLILSGRFGFPLGILKGRLHL